MYSFHVFRYAEHVASAEEDSVAPLDTPSHVVMLTNDADNKRRAAAEGVNASTMRDYVTDILKIPELEDLLSFSDEAGEALNGKGPVTHFPPHLSLGTIQAGLKTGDLLQGVYHASRWVRFASPSFLSLLYIRNVNWS